MQGNNSDHKVGNDLPTTASAPDAVTLHARVMELLFISGDAVTLTISQIAAILGVDAAWVVAEMRTNHFVTFDENTQTVTLLRQSRKVREDPVTSHDVGGESDAEKGVNRRTRRPQGVDTSSDSSESTENGDDGAEATDSTRKPTPRTGQQQKATPLPQSPSKAGSSQPLSPSSPSSSAHRALGAVESEHQQLHSFPSQAKSPQRRQQQSSGKPPQRRRKAPILRIGSLSSPLHPPPSALGLATSSTGNGRGDRSGERKHGSGEPFTALVTAASSTATTVTSHRTGGAGGSVTQPLSALTGRVGYACVAEELKLGEMRSYYNNLGYFTKFDLGVLHVRLPSKESASPSFPNDSANPLASPSQAAAGGEDYGSPTTSNFILQRKSNFDLFLFEYGSVVWWGSDQRFFGLVESDFLLPHSEASRFLVNRYPTQLVTENYPVWCSYSLVRKESLDVDDDFKKKLRFDHFLIPFGRQGSEDASLCGTTMLCCSHALAQSAKIDYLELKVQALTEACAPLPRELKQQGHANITERRLLQLRGELLSYRLMLNSESDLLDEPDFFWENAYLKPIFEATSEAFSIDDRVEALENKLNASNEILSVLAEEFSQRHGARLEWIVIWLVFVEVIIGVLELAVDFKPWFYRGKGS